MGRRCSSNCWKIIVVSYLLLFICLANSATPDSNQNSTAKSDESESGSCFGRGRNEKLDHKGKGIIQKGYDKSEYGTRRKTREKRGGSGPPANSGPGSSVCPKNNWLCKQG